MLTTQVHNIQLPAMSNTRNKLQLVTESKVPTFLRSSAQLKQGWCFSCHQWCCTNVHCSYCQKSEVRLHYSAL